MDYPIIPAQLPTGFCFTDPQSVLNAFAAASVARIPVGSGKQWVFSAAKPADTSVGWFQLDTFGNPIRPYLFGAGAWLSRHSVQPGMGIWWFNALPDTPDGDGRLPNFDGGDGTSGNPTPVSGAMWELLRAADGTVITARMPILAGTLPSGTVLNVGDTGGEEAHALTVPEMPPHTHNLSVKVDPQTGADTLCVISPDLPNSGHTPKNPFVTDSTGGTGSPPAVVAHNTLPLYIVGYCLVRTAKVYYVVS